MERKHGEIKNRWEQRKKSILDIVNLFVALPPDNIYEICSKGIEYDNADRNLIALFNRLITEKKPASLSPEYNWIQKLVMNK